MLKSAKLPFLPGFSFEREVGQSRFHKSTQFEYLRGLIPYLTEATRPGVGGYPLSWETPDTTPSFYPRRDTKELPGWIAFDGQVLTFEAYFQEALWEVHKSPYQVRKVKIYYFPEDGTIQVTEPKVDNSGMTQGLLIARQRIRFPKPMDHGFFDILDLNIGKNVELFGRVYRIVNCDNFTRNFLNRMGIFVGDPLNYPPDPHAEEEDRKKLTIVGKRPRKTEPVMGKYLEYDKKVLRFYGYWDDRSSQYGYVHKLIVFFFLADDKMEIHEILPPNSGIELGNRFLKKLKLPKVFEGLPGPGEEETYSLLNLLPTGFLKGRSAVDPISYGIPGKAYYRDNDLAIGATLNVFGRKVILVDCDEFTKDYYRTKYGIDTFEKLPIPDDSSDFVLKERQLPPWNGFGTYEDSEMNCRKVLPDAPKRDIYKFLSKGRMGMDSHVLRFKAKMISVDPINNDRTFIICYFLAEDQISVFEKAARNSGFASQYMFKKREIFKPNQDKFVSVKPDTFQKHDLWVGNIVTFESFKFKIISADEYCLRYMELHSQEFPKSNTKLILEKIREKLRPVYKDFISCVLTPNVKEYCGTAVIHFCDLKNALFELLGDEISEHEIITIARQYRLAPPKLTRTKQEVINACRTECRRLIWLGFERLQEYLRYRDPCCSNFIPRNCAYSLCKGAKIPIEYDLLDTVFNLVEKNECGDVAIDDLLNFFDTGGFLSRPVIPFNQKREYSEFTEMKENTDYSWVDCNCLLKAIGLEESLAKDGHAKGTDQTELTPEQAATLPH